MTPKGIFYPTSWTLSVIQPKLCIYRNGKREPLRIPWDVSPSSVVSLLVENGYLTSPAPSRLIFIVHGFRNTVDTPWMINMKDAMLSEAAAEADQLIILVGWGNGADLLAIEYLQAGANIKPVGDWLAPIAAAIADHSPKLTIWGVGHSLGAHLLGIAGRKSGVFDRITGLDPAGPAFEHGEFMKLRLNPTDAKSIVDVIHTDGYDNLLDPSDWFSPVNHYGTLIPLGTADFYPNFGYCQPGSGTFSIAGSHTRAIDLYIWSVGNPNKFNTNLVLDGVPKFEVPVKEVKPIKTVAEMGYYYTCHRKGKVSDEGQGQISDGLFYIETNKAEPWVGPPVIPPNSCAIV